MSIRNAVLAISFVALPTLSAEGAEECAPLEALHSMQLKQLRDGRVAMPVVFGETAGHLILDSADVAHVPEDGGATRTTSNASIGLGNEIVRQPNYAGIVGTLTTSAVEELGLSPSNTGARVRTSSGGYRSEQKVSVDEFSFQGLSPFETQFIVSTDEGEGAAYLGTFSINNYRQFNFDIDLDFLRRSARLFSRERCEGQTVDWPNTEVGSVTFTIDGNGFIRFPVNIDGEEFSAVLDTGSSITTVDFGYARRQLDFDEDDPKLTKVAEAADGRAIYKRSFESISFGDVALANPELYLVPGVATRNETRQTGSRINRSKRGTIPPLIVGMTTLRQLRVFIAYDENKIYFAPNGRRIR